MSSRAAATTAARKRPPRRHPGQSEFLSPEVVGRYMRFHVGGHRFHLCAFSCTCLAYAIDDECYTPTRCWVHDHAE